MKEKTLTIQKVLSAISNEESQEMIKIIDDGKNSYDVVQKGKMTRKQYYLRLAKLEKLDLVKKVGKRYTLTTFGNVIYEAQLRLVLAVNNQWKMT